jgi:hypothetical protein
MSEDQRPKQHEEDEVEAHHGHRKAANPEAKDEAEKDNEVEAHHHHRLAHPKKA